MYRVAQRFTFPLTSDRLDGLFFSTLNEPEKNQLLLQRCFEFICDAHKRCVGSLSPNSFNVVSVLILVSFIVFR